MKNKQVRKFLATLSVAVAVSSVPSVTANAAEAGESTAEEGTCSESTSSESTGSESTSNESTSSESTSSESSESEESSGGGMTTIETKNEDGSTTTTYTYEETIKADNLADAVEKAQEKTEEQEKIKSEIEGAGGTYDYTVEIKDNSTTEEVTDRYDTKGEAEEATEKVDGTITEVEGETKEGESASQDGFASEEEAKEWAAEKEQELIDKQTGDSSEKVTTETIISKVEGTGITSSTEKTIEEKTFDTEEEAKEYAESFKDAEYTITPVNGKWVYQKKEITVTDGDGNTIYFETKEEADKYIEDNKVEGAFLEKIEVVDSETEEVKETVTITATSYEDYVEKVKALYAEAAANENISIAESMEYVLEHYKTSVNFEEMTEEEKRELMEQMKEDAKDQNYTYMHLDLQTAANLNVYDDEGNSQKVACSIKDDSTLHVRVFTEINGKMTEVTMDTNITKDPQGYWEICSANRWNLNLKKSFVLIEGTLEYTLDGETKSAPFSTTGYLNNDYNTCSMKPGQGGHSSSGGFDILLDDFTMDNEGKVTIKSSVTKVYTIKVTKNVTKYVVKYEVDDPETGVYTEDYKVKGTFVEEIEIPAEYMAEVTSQLNNILYDVNYTKTDQEYEVIIDGDGNVTVIPKKPDDNNNNNNNNGGGEHHHSKDKNEPKTEVIVEIPVQQEEIIPVKETTSVIKVESPKTGDEASKDVAMACGGLGSSILLGAAMFLKRKKKDMEV